MPYRPHSQYPSPYAAPAARTRPSAAWFAVGGVLIVVAGIVFGIAIVRFVRSIAHDDAVFQASGVHQVTLPADTQRAVFVRVHEQIPRCGATGSGGGPVQFRRPIEDFSYGDWVAVRVFDTGDGRITFSCAPAGTGEIRIARIPSGGELASLGLFAILFPLGVGGAGFVILLVTTVLWITRPTVQPPGTQLGRQPGTPPAWSPRPAPSQYPGWQPGPPASPPPGGPRGPQQNGTQG